jgi:hypothetical protein
VRTQVLEFVLKTEVVDDSARFDTDQVASSRRMLTDKSMANFREQPLIGIGFGVQSEPPYALVRSTMESAGPGVSAEEYFPDAYGYARDPLFNIPLEGSSEKGTTPVAVLEEVGIIGFIFFLFMVGALFLPNLRATVGLAPGALMATALLINMGEAVFFSFGGAGVLIWLLFGLAYTEAVHGTPPKAARHGSRGRVPVRRAP